MARTNSFSLNNGSETIYNSFIPNSYDKLLKTNNLDVNWNNKASVMMDPWLSDNGKITVNRNFLHRGQFETKDNFSSPSITVPPDYLNAKLIIYKGGDKHLELPVLFPGSFSNSISATYAKESPVGSNKPIIAFEHTDAESFPFSFVALADYLPTGYNTLESYIEAIKEMVKPYYDGQIVKSPSVQLVIANYAILCVCTSVNITYDELYNNQSFVKANISCEFTRLD